ncbi:hypothetical protein [Sphingosinicella terrae]|jgi:hypothetical protein|uniref:hypothetical protein n=1 Tax=Sphingosinicella terrae TaxID=2172047 RepID=UPI00254917C3|nr:hypothetical protein [Sphingosinicella terrae]
MAGSTAGCAGRGLGSAEPIAYIADMAKRLPDKTVVEVEGPIDPGKPDKARYRIVRRDGTQVRLRVIDADGPRFAADLQASFAANVRRARAENRALNDD